MRVYIAGPMSGKEFYNVAAFTAAAADWRALGFEVVTPFDANSIAWRFVYGRDFDPYKDTCDWGDPVLAEMLAQDFAALCRADAVALLDGWEQSKGTRAELLVALNLGKPIYSATTHGRLTLAASVSFSVSQ